MQSDYTCFLLWIKSKIILEYSCLLDVVITNKCTYSGFFGECISILPNGIFFFNNPSNITFTNNEYDGMLKELGELIYYIVTGKKLCTTDTTITETMNLLESVNLFFFIQNCVYSAHSEHDVHTMTKLLKNRNVYNMLHIFSGLQETRYTHISKESRVKSNNFVV